MITKTDKQKSMDIRWMVYNKQHKGHDMTIQILQWWCRQQIWHQWTTYTSTEPYQNFTCGTLAKFNRLLLMVTKYVLTYNDKIEHVEQVTCTNVTFEFKLWRKNNIFNVRQCHVY